MPTDTLEKQLTREDVRRLLDDGYRVVEILEHGRVREAPRNGHDPEETVGRTLKTRSAPGTEPFARGRLASWARVLE